MAPNDNIQRRQDEENDERLQEAHEGVVTDYKKIKVGNDEYLETEEEERIAAELEQATWGEVYTACCVHSKSEWVKIAFGIFLILFTLYWFMLALDIMGNAAKVLSGCRASTLFGEGTNPLAAAMIGAIATILLDSSSTTTSIIISMTGTLISLDQAIYMVMGCNIGTTLTSTIIAASQMGNSDRLERAFAGSTIHDMYNYLSVALFLPLEVAFHLLRRLTALMVQGVSTSDGDEWAGPVKKIVDPMGDLFIMSNSKLLKAVANEEGTCEPGGGFYPIICEPGTPTFDTCEQVGLIACSKKTNRCPLMFSPTATEDDDKLSGGVMLFLAVCLLFLCLGILVMILSKMLSGLTNSVILKATTLNGYSLIGIGCGLTMLVQSSSLMCSILVPLVGVGAIQLEQMYALVLGANVGTCITGLMAALVTEGVTPLQVALCHLMFNVFGILAFYVIPFTRLPLAMGRWLGKMTRKWRGFPILYIIILFVIIPVVTLGLSLMYDAGKPGTTALAIVFTVGILFFFLSKFYYLRFRGGWQKWMDYFEQREAKRMMMVNLGSDLEYLKEKVALILDHTGLEKKDSDTEELEKESLEKELQDVENN